MTITITTLIRDIDFDIDTDIVAALIGSAAEAYGDDWGHIWDRACRSGDTVAEMGESMRLDASDRQDRRQGRKS